MLTNSWVIIDKTTGKAVFETYDDKIIEYINAEKYTVYTAYDYLCKLNKSIKEVI